MLQLAGAAACQRDRPWWRPNWSPPRSGPVATGPTRATHSHFAGGESPHSVLQRPPRLRPYLYYPRTRCALTSGRAVRPARVPMRGQGRRSWCPIARRRRRIRKPPQPIDLRKTAYIREVSAPFSWQLPYAWPRKPVLARNVVATSQPLAAQAGLQAMADGGNAVDAIVATAVTLTLVEPVSNGIGSDAFAIVWDGRQLHGLNASGRSPAAWTPEYFSGDAVPPFGAGTPSRCLARCRRGWRCTASLAGCRSRKLFEPAIHYGRNGFLVSPTIAAQWAQQVPLFGSQPGFADAFLRNGRAPMPGELFTFPEHAATLEKIAATNGEAFYRGELAAAMEAHVKRERRRDARQ